jgi:predicted RNase H-like nuclease (RuvC/YqgF family)
VSSLLASREGELLESSGRGRFVTPLLALTIIVMCAAFAFTYELDSGTISSLNQSITSQRSLINSQVSQLDVDLTRISNLTSTITSLRGQVSSLNSRITSDQAEITSLTSGYARGNTTVTTLQSEVASLNSQIVNLDAKVATLNTQIPPYQSELASLRLQVRQLESILTAINTALGEPVAQVIENDVTFSVLAGSERQFQFTSIGVGSVLLVGVASSTSSNTIVSLGETTDPFNVGNGSVVAFNIIECCDNFTVNIYSQNMTNFTATVSIWYFHY